MINIQLFDPKSIVVVGASENRAKPGGKLLHNIRTGTFGGELYALNPGKETVQGLPCFGEVSELPDTDLAFLAVPAAACVEIIRDLAEFKKTRAFIIISAGFSEEDERGASIEKEIVAICNTHNAALVGPNCIGVMTPAYQGVFTLPIPKLDPDGCDFISGSGATAVFIMEAGIQNGLTFNHVFSVGNSAQLGVEDVLQHFDETYHEGHSSRVKMLYFETIKDPGKLFRHASSLIRKGCRIAAIKAGTTGAGSRAATSHTGALASSDMAVDALFRKAGIVRCTGREELTTVASIMRYPPLKGKNLAIITHAGGPAVMLTDVLAMGDLDVPRLTGPAVEELLTHLFPGSSASNPIDMLATGNAEQLGDCIDFCENRFPEIDGVVVIFGSPGLAPVYDVYEVLDSRMRTCSKPIYPVLPSITTARAEVEEFISRGHINFPDEVAFGHALVKIQRTMPPAGNIPDLDGVDLQGVRRIVSGAGEGFMDPETLRMFMEAAGIPVVKERLVTDEDALAPAAREIGFPLAMKVVGPVHKSDVGGVELGVEDDSSLLEHYRRMKKIRGVTGVLLQPMLSGVELFAGARYEPNFGHLVLCGMGGIYVEVMQDIASGLAPLEYPEAVRMIRSLRGYPLLKGTRGGKGIDLKAFATILVRLSGLLTHTREITEVDLNPLIADGSILKVVDARIRIDKRVI